MTQNIIDFFKYGFENLLLFWCPWGRISRRSYVCFYWFYIILAGGLLTWLMLKKQELNLYFLLLIVPWETAAIRRGHDLGCSGWYTVCHFIRGFHFVYRLLYEEGDVNCNEYGPAPR